MLTVGSLFSGIGGLDLGLEWAGMQVKWQVENDDYAQRVLAKQWPNVARFRDVRDCGSRNLEWVDCTAGGFPCQGISDAGQRVGLDDPRSGLWSEFRRIIGELRPRYVLVENVSALLGRGMGVVVGDLAQLGYDTEWSIISACALGAPHTRERLFILGYATGERGSRRRLARNGRTRGEGPSPRVRQEDIQPAAGSGALSRHGWAVEPGVGRVAYGVPDRVDRLRGLGNAVIPQKAELIGRYIIAKDAEL